MSQAALQAAAFYREVAERRAVWTLRDDDGFPAPQNESGQRAQPFWSSRERAERVIATVEAYARFIVVEISWDAFCARWAPGLARDGVLVGVNWSGPRAAGYDLAAGDVVKNVEALDRETKRA